MEWAQEEPILEKCPADIILVITVKRLPNHRWLSSYERVSASFGFQDGRIEKTNNILLVECRRNSSPKTSPFKYLRTARMDTAVPACLMLVILDLSGEMWYVYTKK